MGLLAILGVDEHVASNVGKATCFVDKDGGDAITHIGWSPSHRLGWGTLVRTSLLG